MSKINDILSFINENNISDELKSLIRNSVVRNVTSLAHIYIGLKSMSRKYKLDDLELTWKALGYNWDLMFNDSECSVRDLISGRYSNYLKSSLHPPFYHGSLRDDLEKLIPSKSESHVSAIYFSPEKSLVDFTMKNVYHLKQGASYYLYTLDHSDILSSPVFYDPEGQGAVESYVCLNEVKTLSKSLVTIL